MLLGRESREGGGSTHFLTDFRTEHTIAHMQKSAIKPASSEAPRIIVAWWVATRSMSPAPIVCMVMFFQ